MGSRCRPGQAALADRGRRAGRRSGGRAARRSPLPIPPRPVWTSGRPHRRRRNQPRLHRRRLRRGLHRPVGPQHRRDGRRRPAGHAGRPPAVLLRRPTRNSPAPARTSVTRCCATRATRPTCATPATRPRPRAARSNGVTTRKRNRAWCIRAICRKKAKPTGRRRSATSSSTRSWSRWSARWS